MTDAIDTVAANVATAPEATARPKDDTAPRKKRGRGGRGGKRANPNPNTGANANATDADAGASGTPANAGKPGAPAHAGARSKTQPRKPHPVLEKLFELYPGLFGARFLPLKRGVYEELIARHPEVFKAEDLKVAMGLHARSTRYLEAVAAGHPRHDLEGNVVEPVAPEHVHHAILEIFRRRKNGAPEEIAAQLRKRIAAAIEASGLPRDEYAALVRSQRDEAANAALDDAVAELATQAAKREALLRAFEASGRSEAEFADMYGMSPADVARTLKRARSDKAAAATSAAT
ncbi:ProQ/FINO family protein [Variovorax sp. J22R133]|uniref:ProQ/FINO family protein n=1 Tax=Variovorax brevis TaxID=3053503 RepID=UPI00257535F1|nr:ProQ/FINO family protein [Variovorax sp. J22R133]MDM0114609.1 ProQ/FINO family protein [Variovorax sp. J22R133]